MWSIYEILRRISIHFRASFARLSVKSVSITRISDGLTGICVCLTGIKLSVDLVGISVGLAEKMSPTGKVFD